MPAAPPVLDAATRRDDIPCLLCGGEDHATMHEKAPFRIVRCRGCGMVYTLPRLSPEALHDMYQEGYWSSGSAKDFGYTDYLADAELYRRTFRMRSALLRKYVAPPARLLDVGCAAGFALEVLRDQGYDVWGLEISRKMVEECRAKLGTDRIHHGPLESDTFAGQHFDVITMWDVVEHVEDPIELLCRARQLLSERGVIVLETQNVASLFARLLGVNWTHYKFQEHLYHFDPKTIRVLLEKAGLELLEESPRRGGKHVSLGFIVERVGRIHPWLSKLLSPLKVLRRKTLYVNVFDEMLVVARARASGAADRDG